MGASFLNSTPANRSAARNITSLVVIQSKAESNFVLRDEATGEAGQLEGTVTSRE